MTVPPATPDVRAVIHHERRNGTEQLPVAAGKTPRTGRTTPPEAPRPPGDAARNHVTGRNVLDSRNE
ncbi:hypothetical protein SAMN02787144_100775 [Streptomyces atratus]|uniref:Uncharacterized protein n=1 Tax=Streptomyces atratus TaxID=1893 RepID=A0A1K2AII3_STRAR|nr:hypothetical protein SAMN02787144_100775 [Streptomyces atratus]